MRFRLTYLFHQARTTTWPPHPAIHAFPAGDSTTSGNSLSTSISSPQTSTDSPTPSHHNILPASIISRPSPEIPSSTNSQPHPPSNPTMPRMVTRSQNKIYKPIFFFNYMTNPSIPFTPSTFKQANKHAHWRKAMKSEFATLLKNQTWDLVPKDPTKNIIDCKWLFKIKHKAYGSMDQ